jgi:hypothetical protein
MNMHARFLGAVTALLVIGTSGCDSGDVPEIAEVPGIPPATETTTPSMETAPPSTTTTRVADIMENPAAFNGREVTIVAEVDEVLSPRAFKLDEDSPLAGGVDNDLVVLYPQSATLADLDDQWLDDEVRVTGTIRTMNIVDIEREIGWDLDPRIEVRLEGMKPVLVARTVERVGGGM